MLRAAVLVSGGGTNLQALIDSKARGELPSCELALVLSSNPESRALDRAHAAGIEMVVVARKAFKEGTEFDRAVLVELRARNIDVVVLAGFLQILGKELITAYRDRIINVH
ncbi:MAG: formyltransferase family protein, partial [Oscillospiraceae bacterium]